MPKAFQILGIISFLVSCWACEPKVEDQSKEDIALARVFKQKLMSSDIEGMFADSPTEQDSMLMANTFVENWVRENLLMQEAEKNIPKDLNIDELVRNYRASLVKHNYEKLIIELQLDSVVTQAQLTEYYNLNKEQFKLEYPLLQLDYCKLPTSVSNLSSVKTWWTNSADSTNYSLLLDFCGNYATYFILGKKKWIPFEPLKTQLPNNVSASQLQVGANINVENNGFLHLLKVNQRLEKGAYAPMSYIKDKAERFLLHKRKMKLLEEKKEEMYDREMRLKNIEIYTK